MRRHLRQIPRASASVLARWSTGSKASSLLHAPQAYRHASPPRWRAAAFLSRWHALPLAQGLACGRDARFSGCQRIDAWRQRLHSGAPPQASALRIAAHRKTHPRGYTRRPPVEHLPAIAAVGVTGLAMPLLLSNRPYGRRIDPGHQVWILTSSIPGVLSI